MSIISAPRVLIDGRLSGPAAVVVDDAGVITDVLDEIPPRGRGHFALDSGVLSPGLVDLQVNGAFGVDLFNADAAGWRAVASALTSVGVTAFQPTFITAPLDALVEGLDRGALAREKLRGEPVARVLGVHLEGPFLSPERPGVHRPELMCPPTPAAIKTLLASESAEALTMVTIAPELPEAIAAIRTLTAAGVKVSVGHTDALASQVEAAADAGATLVTHVFNAQRGLGHREPGAAGAALSDPRLTVGLIADLRHVAPQVCSLVFQAAADRTALVSDAMAAAGMPPGRYQLGSIEVQLAAEDAPRDADGVIAGSALTLDLAVRNLVGVGCNPATVLTAASQTPADAIGRPDLGRISVGAAADLVWWSDDFHPLCTWVAGAAVYAAPNGGDDPARKALAG